MLSHPAAVQIRPLRRQAEGRRDSGAQQHALHAACLGAHGVFDAQGTAAVLAGARLQRGGERVPAR